MTAGAEWVTLSMPMANDSFFTPYSEIPLNNQGLIARCFLS